MYVFNKVGVISHLSNVKLSSVHYPHDLEI